MPPSLYFALDNAGYTLFTDMELSPITELNIYVSLSTALKYDLLHVWQHPNAQLVYTKSITKS